MHILPRSLGRQGKTWVILPAGCILLLLSLLGVFLFLRTRAKVEYELRERLTAAAVLAAMHIDAADVTRMQDPQVRHTETYRRMVAELEGLQTSVPRVRFVYVLRKAPGNDPFMLEFVADADGLKPAAALDRNGNGVVDPDEERSVPGDLYDARQAPAMLDAFVSPATDPSVTTDKWGTFISGYAPIRDGDGNAVAILGVDMTAEDFFDHARDFFPFLLVLLFTGIGAVIGLYVAFLSRERGEQERARATLLQNLPGVAYRCRNDQDWTMEFLSDGCRELTGYAPSELLKNRERTYASLMHPDDRKQVWNDVQNALRERKPYLLTYRIKTEEGREKWVWEQGCGVYAADGALLFLEGFIMDITERKRLDRARGDFLRAASHQLRTPIATVRWSLETLKDSKECPLQGMQKDIVEDVERYATRMAETVDMMLRVSELESRQVQPTTMEVPLQSILEEARGLFQSTLEEKEQTVSIRCPAHLQIHTDPAMLKEIFSVLLQNAIVYSPAKSEIEIAVLRENGRVQIDVADRGCGIPEAEQYKVFTRFFRAANAPVHAPDGTGLGLSLASSLAQLLGGSLSFASEEKKGSTFSLTLPI